MLYKFSPIDIFLYKNLMNGTLWFSNPREFNDLHEFSMQVDRTISDEKANAYYDVLNRLDDNYLQQNCPRELFIKISRNKPEQVVKLITDAIETRMNTFGVTCFSEDVFNDLMWGNYASRHNGVALGFEDELLDSSILKANGVITVLSGINYQDEKPQVSFATDLTSIAEAIYGVVVSKHTVWQNEKETRIISNKQGLHYFDKGSLKEVYFGVRTQESEVKDIINLITNFNYNDVNFFKLIPLSYNNYEKQLIHSI